MKCSTNSYHEDNKHSAAMLQNRLTLACCFGSLCTTGPRALGKMLSRVIQEQQVKCSTNSCHEDNRHSAAMLQNRLTLACCFDSLCTTGPRALGKMLSRVIQEQQVKCSTNSYHEHNKHSAAMLQNRLTLACCFGSLCTTGPRALGKMLSRVIQEQQVKCSTNSYHEDNKHSAAMLQNRLTLACCFDSLCTTGPRALGKMLSRVIQEQQVKCSTNSYHEDNKHSAAMLQNRLTLACCFDSLCTTGPRTRQNA